jgi:hypothetical protein
MNTTLTYTNRDRGTAAILRPNGALDWSTYADLIAQAWAARSAGAHSLIVDLRGVERVGLAGLLGLYAVARLAQGGPPFDMEAGWAAIRALVDDHPPLSPLAVLHPRPTVRQALTRAPYCAFFAIHTDLDAALAGPHPQPPLPRLGEGVGGEGQTVKPYAFI